MRIGLIGSGGREHAIAEALTRGDSASTLCAYLHFPNPGIVARAEALKIGSLIDVQSITRFFQRVQPDLIFVGPEAPLAAGAVDALAARGLPAIGPTKAQARLESDKAYMRRLLRERVGYGYPDHLETSEISEVKAFIANQKDHVVVKPVGLTGGKGVRLLGANLTSAEKAVAYASELIAGDGRVLMEERLLGEEFSLMAFSDGQHVVPMPLAQDFKYAYDGDQGGMTGGMGAYTCADGSLPFVTELEYRDAFGLVKEILAAVQDDTQQPYRGVLYGQFMLTARGPIVVECNVRLGDPEAINVLAASEDDLGDVLSRIAGGTLSVVAFGPQATVSKYLVPDGYPGPAEGGSEFRLDLRWLERQGVGVRFASVTARDDGYEAGSSRAFALLALADTPAEASERIERVIAGMDLPGLRHRRDVGHSSVLEAKVQHMEQLRVSQREELRV
jgi:phosphoribosylamine--glycine ligase